MKLINPVCVWEKTLVCKDICIVTCWVHITVLSPILVTA